VTRLKERVADKVTEVLQSKGSPNLASAPRRLAKSKLPWVDIPHMVNVRQARSDLSKILRKVGQGEAFLVKGPKNRDALIISVDTYRALYDSYLELLGELEARDIAEDDETREQLRAASESKDYQTLDELEERYADELQERPSGQKDPSRP
jgi:antitoxin (DNA-binding transcriptional repressor) of toxin-antitoxin stability system